MYYNSDYFILYYNSEVWHLPSLKLELKKKAAEELKLKTIQKKDSIAKAWDEKRAPELKKANDLHKKYLDAWLAANPGKTEKDYSKYLEKQKYVKLIYHIYLQQETLVLLIIMHALNIQ